MKIIKYLILSGFVALGLGLSHAGNAQDEPVFSQAELDQMLAPVALYPDTVLSHVLIAATYPLEIVQAARWSRSHPELRGEAAVRAVEGFGWDPSVQALVAFPELLERMDRDLEWTQRLGDAFLLQESDVVATVQYLRDQAYAQGNLESNEYVRVIREKEYIYIEPSRTRVVYIPYYDPRYVYGHWRWAGYPPYYWSRPAGFSLSVGFHWGIGYSIWDGFFFSAFHWPSYHVVVVDHHHYHYGHENRRYRTFDSGRALAHYEGARRWKHDPQHRRGVSYRHGVDQTRFVKAGEATRAVAGSKGKYVTSAVKRPVTREQHREWADRQRGGSGSEGTVSRLEKSKSVGYAPARKSGSDAASRAAMSHRERAAFVRKPTQSSTRSSNAKATVKSRSPSAFDPKSAQSSAGSSKAEAAKRPSVRATSPASNRTSESGVRSIRDRLAASERRSPASHGRKETVRSSKSVSRDSRISSRKAPEVSGRSGRADGYSSPSARHVPSSRSRATLHSRSADRKDYPTKTRRAEPKAAPSDSARRSFGTSRPISRSAPTTRSLPKVQSPRSLPPASSPFRGTSAVPQSSSKPSAVNSARSFGKGQPEKRSTSKGPFKRDR